MKALACSVACFAWVTDAWIANTANEERKGRLAKKGRREHLTARLKTSGLASLLFGQGAQALQSRMPIRRREQRTLGSHQNRKLALLRPLSARRSNAEMFDLPPATEQVWVEKNIPVHEERVLFLGGTLDDELVKRIIASLIWLDSVNHSDIYLYINSSGGGLGCGQALIETMQHIKSDVITINIGYAGSMASLILGSGVRGKRIGLSSSVVMVHASDIGDAGRAWMWRHGSDEEESLMAENIKRYEEYFISMYADMTGQPREKLIDDMSSGYDKEMTAQQALDYGLIDTIIETDPSWDLAPKSRFG